MAFQIEVSDIVRSVLPVEEQTYLDIVKIASFSKIQGRGKYSEKENWKTLSKMHARADS